MVCIQICSNGEWRSLKELLAGIDYKTNNYPFGEFIKLKLYGKECIFYHSGATKTKSSAACQFAIDNWEPEMVIVLGTCGGVDKKLNVLDVIIANKTVQYDCIDRMGKEPCVFYEPFTTIIDNSWIHLNEFHGNVYEGMIATADQDINYEVLKMLRKEDVLCADWESGAIAYICRLNKVRNCIVRGITDIPTENADESAISQGTYYRQNTPRVMKKLIEDILPVLFKNMLQEEKL